MLTIRRTPPAEVAANHARWEARRRPAVTAAAPAPLPRNVTPILDLGNTVFFTFRGRAYGVPPVPYQRGLALQRLWYEARGFGDITPENQAAYAATIARFVPLLWRLVRPVGVTRRALRWLGLHRNPFRAASERELVEVASFVLGCRMRSSVGFPTPTAPLASPTS